MIKTAFKPFKPDVLKEYIYAFGNFMFIELHIEGVWVRHVYIRLRHPGNIPRTSGAGLRVTTL